MPDFPYSPPERGLDDYENNLRTAMALYLIYTNGGGGGGGGSFASLTGSPYDNANLAAALNALESVSPGNDFAFIFPQTGNDVGATGTMNAPYATIQQAHDDGCRSFFIGNGNAGNLNVPGGTSITVFGMASMLSVSQSRIGEVTSNGSSISIYDPGVQSVRIGPISTVSTSTGQAAGSISLYNTFVWGNVTLSGSAGTGDENGGDGGSITVSGPASIIGNISVAGGNGSGAGSGGNAGSILIQRNAFFTGNPNISGGTGSPSGSDGQFTVKLAEFSGSAPGVGTTTYIGAVVNDVFTPS